jgi:type I restriction enzyme S subunit
MVATRPYPAYEDSGVSWLGDLPEGWGVERQRHVADMLVSNIDKLTVEGELPVRLCNYVDVYKHDRITRSLPFMQATATKDEVDRFRLQLGDVLITKDSEAWTDIGVPSLVEYTAPDFVCGYHLAILRPREGVFSGGYLLRALQSQGVAVQFRVAANGVTRYGLSHEAIKSVLLPVPSLAEQAGIVRFLDHADRRIRRYIAAKRRLIALLDEQKQAIVHHAVTRGLDPNVRLKPSGVEWLGDVPEHWEIVRNGRLFTQRNETGVPDLPILEVSLRTGVRVRTFGQSERKQVMADRAKYKRATGGDIAYNMMRMWQGAVGVAPVDGLVSPAYVVARPLPGTEVRYFSALFRTAAYMGEVDKYSHGIVKDRNRLYWEDFKQIPTPCPPEAEQVQIADAIEAEATALNEATSRIQQEIALVREYWTRLVCDLVTGKLDVRAAGAELPDEAREAEFRDDAEAFAEDEEPFDAGDRDGRGEEVDG